MQSPSPQYEQAPEAEAAHRESAGPHKKGDPVLDYTRFVINTALRILAVAMAVVVVLSVVDVIWYTFLDIIQGPPYLLEIEEIFKLFGIFMAVLIAVEIYANITLYLREGVVHVKIVMATALIASARKVIILEIDKLSALEVIGIAAVVLAMSLGYYLAVVMDRGDQGAHAQDH